MSMGQQNLRQLARDLYAHVFAIEHFAEVAGRANDDEELAAYEAMLRILARKVNDICTNLRQCLNSRPDMYMPNTVTNLLLTMIADHVATGGYSDFVTSMDSLYMSHDARQAQSLWEKMLSDADIDFSALDNIDPGPGDDLSDF